MKKVLSWVSVTILTFWGLSASAAADLTKLAVLPTLPELANSADLLAAGLSTRGGVTLLEREQVARVWREQELAAAQRIDWVKLGRLLNADGVLALDRRTEDTNEMLAVRLIAVKPGVVITEHRFPLPLSKPDEWGQSYAAQLERLLPKLRVKPEDAVPISLLNLRASLVGSDSALEQELTALLTLRLTREPALFVLERRRLEALQLEKELTSVEPEPFWNGAYILDGTINRDVVSRETVTVHARLAPPRGDAVNIEASGQRSTLGQVADELAQQVLKMLSKVAVPQTWRNEAEAEKFLQEAVWAWRWNATREAAEAADASWALGCRTVPAAAYRVVSRASLAYRMRGELEYRSGGYGFRLPPAPEVLVLSSRALEIYRDASRELSSGPQGIGESWRSVGLNALGAISAVLDLYHQRVELRQGREEDLRKVRALAREVSDLLAKPSSAVSMRVPYHPKDLPFAFVSGKYFALTSLCEIWLAAGGGWFEKPSDAVVMYHGILEPSVYPVARQALLRLPLPLVAWSVDDRPDVPRLWTQFLFAMAASTNDQVRLDGLRLMLAHGKDPGELETAADQFVNQAWSARRAIFRRELDAPVSLVISNLVRRVEHWGRPAVEPLRAVERDWVSRFVAVEPDLSYEEWTDLLCGLTNRPTSEARFVEPPTPPRPHQVSLLIAQLEAMQRGGQIPREASDRFLDRLKALASLPKPASESVPNGVVKLPSSVQTQSVALAVSRKWSLENMELPNGRAYYCGSRFRSKPLARDLLWHNNRLWFGTRTCRDDVQDIKSRPTLVSLDPQSMQAEMIEAPFDERTIPFTPCHSVLIGHDLFICSEDAMWRRNANGDWSRLPQIAPGSATPCAWGNRIVLDFERSILEYDPQTTQARILASTRRNPVAGALDQATGPWGPLAVLNGEVLCARVRCSGGGYQVWSFDSTRQDWVLFRTATNCGERVQVDSSVVWYRQSGQCGPRMLGGWRPGSSALECYTWEETTGTNRAGQISPYTSPLWLHPTNIHPHDRQAAFEGSDLWIFPTPGVTDSSLTTSPRSLLCLGRRYAQALELRLEFAGSTPYVEAAFDAARVKRMPPGGGGFQPYVEFLPTPAGLAMLITEGGIVLWVPKADLDAAREESQRRYPQPERLDFAAFTRFDINRNGWLDDAERRTMRHDTRWQIEEEGATKAAIAAAISRHGTEWDAVFTTADRDGNSKLSALELTAAVADHPALFGGRLRGVNAALAQAMRPYDLDGDLMFDRAESRAFLGDPRLVAEVNRSVNWVKNYGLKPEACDTNGDGVLDDGERAQVDRMIESRQASDAARGE